MSVSLQWHLVFKEARESNRCLARTTRKFRGRRFRLSCLSLPLLRVLPLPTCSFKAELLQAELQGFLWPPSKVISKHKNQP